MKRNKSKMTKIAIVLVIAVFIFSLFKIGTTKASTEVVELTNVEIASKSDTVDVDSVKFEDGKIKNNVTFHKVGDELTYNVTISNKDEKNYVLKTISDNNENESLTYSYSGYEGAKLEANKAATFKVTITYAKEVTDITQREQSNSVVLTLTFEDEAGNEKEEDVVIEPEDKTPTAENNKNPQTGDNIAVYITTAVASLILLIILTRKQMVMKKSSKRNNHGKHGKHGMKMLGLILAIALVVPTFTNISKAATSSLNTTLETSIKFMDKLVVSYEVNGEAKDQVIPYDGTIENLEAPTKEGYNFIGWKLEDGTEVTEETKITADTVLVPQFEEKVKSSTITITVKNEQQREEEKQVTISAVNTNVSDNEVKLQYSLDDGQTWTDYEETITVEENCTVKVRSILIATEEVIGQAEKEIDTVMITAIFKSGPEVNMTMMKLAGEENLELKNYGDIYPQLSFLSTVYGYEMLVYARENQVYMNANIKEVQKASNEKYNERKDLLNEGNVVSAENSKKPIYMWFEDATGTIYYYSEAEKIYLNEDANFMFAMLTIVDDIDLSSIDTSKTTNMSYMFYYCPKLPEVDVSHFNTSKVTDMSYMFSACFMLQELDVSKFDTSKVTDMSWMFAFPEDSNMNIQRLDLSNFDTSNVINMRGMFAFCTKLTELDVSNFDTSNVTDMRLMFYVCNMLQELDVSNFNTSKVTNMLGMFGGCENIKTIYASEQFDLSNVNAENSASMFYGCTNLIGGNGTTYDETKTDKTYAVIDTPTTLGYFTDIADKPTE